MMIMWGFMIINLKIVVIWTLSHWLRFQIFLWSVDILIENRNNTNINNNKFIIINIIKIINIDIIGIINVILLLLLVFFCYGCSFYLPYL